MIKTIMCLSLVIGQVTYASGTQSPTPQQCLKLFAKDYVPEYNDANDYIMSKEKKNILGALDVIKSTGMSNWVKEFAKANLQYADAVGVVFNYDDEVHMIITAINVVNSKCQVKEIADINTVDISESKDETLLAKYFLGQEKSTLPEKVRSWLYDDVRNHLKGEAY